MDFRNYRRRALMKRLKTNIIHLYIAVGQFLEKLEYKW